METVLHGGCLCKSVRYEYAGEPDDASYCHCDDCRRATGGPYTVGVLVKTALLRIVSGKVKGYTTTGDGGSEITREFCPECGSPLFTRAEKDPSCVWLKAGCLDEPQRIHPSYQTWTQCAVPWAHIDEELPSFPKGRPSQADASSLDVRA